MFEFERKFRNAKVFYYENLPKNSPPEHILTLATFGTADHFIGNCGSSYTANAVRERKFLYKLPSSNTHYFGVTPHLTNHEEL